MESGLAQLTEAAQTPLRAIYIRGQPAMAAGKQPH